MAQQGKFKRMAAGRKASLVKPLLSINLIKIKRFTNRLPKKYN